MSNAAEQHNTNGKKCYMNKKYDDAIEHYAKAIKMNPLSKYYQNRAMCHYQVNNLKMAEEDCKRALELSPNEVKPLYFLGNVFLKNKKFNEAINCLSKALYHNSVITNTSDIENALKRARHQKYEDEESRRIVQDVEFHTYLESLIEKDRSENADNPEALQKIDMEKN
uniref:RING-type E3 ubiquitin transferase n=1 Tax=Caenorhabditis japonica TaxID=281687 RepID=A0A8R1EL81_CAEJA